MPANTVPSTLLDGGYFVVSYDLPLENPYAVLPALQGPENPGDPALLDSRASTDLERNNSASSCMTSTLENGTDEALSEADVSVLSAEPRYTAPTNFEDADFKTIDIDKHRMQALKKIVRTEIRHTKIFKMQQVVVSYVWISDERPDISQIQAPQGWKDPKPPNNHIPALLFMVWPRPHDSEDNIWLHSPALGWQTVKTGDAFDYLTDEGEWRKIEGLGKYQLKVHEGAVKLFDGKVSRNIQE
ncbi:hypothetical protein DFH07DRAFT_966854 [Mycena maculata]|uniref:Uncharacterized protein n=1 Tax=Mycena maculata TaxID=230809 RepID=A0AAD7MWR2_9AGAR|nr:hypothetical protein DFH07DRAFT_966854 [Mycena maculata]